MTQIDSLCINYRDGAHISADRNMQASIRVMPGCYITGQAAGMAAAIAALKGTHIRNIEIHDLQTRLKNLGAYLPNFNPS